MDVQSYPLITHFIELRKRLIHIAIAVIICSIVSYFFFDKIFVFLISPLKETLYSFNITEGFLTKIKIAFLTGIFISLPVVLFEIMIFVVPALKQKEKIIILSFVIIGYLLFLTGVYFGYKQILPLSIKFLKQSGFYPDNIKLWLSYSKFIKFVFQFLFGFGLAFELPVIMLVLLKLNIVRKSWLLKNLRIVIVLAFVFSAILTPPDWISQVMLAIPLILLYLISIGIGYIFSIGD